VTNLPSHVANADSETIRSPSSQHSPKDLAEEDGTDEISPDDVRRHVEATVKMNVVAQNQVAERINIKADKMIASTARRFTHKKNPRLKQNDHVRLDLLALTDHRKDAKSGFKKALNLPNWSQEIYKIQQRIDATTTIPDLYVIVDDNGRAPEQGRRNAYYRYQLLLVEDRERLEKLHDVTQKPDFNFGVLTTQQRPRLGANAQVSHEFEVESDKDQTLHDMGEHDDEEHKPDTRPFRQAAAHRGAHGWYASYH
jgi:hypothetical protein